ncbi:MAG: polyhydroxybutyrate depolymerase [Bradymonadia bacterium]|jgi:polyhydroxybutyrate depolymerase
MRRARGLHRLIGLAVTGLLLTALLAGCEGDDGSLYPEEDWPDFNFRADASGLDAQLPGRDLAEVSDGARPDAAESMDGAPNGALDGAFPDADVNHDARLADQGPDAAPMPMVRRSAGCGQMDPYSRGGEWIRALDFGPAAGGVRGFYLTVPQRYDPDVPSRLIFGYPGTDWVGGQIRDYLRIEGGVADEIFVYPDPLWRDFGNWGERGGWQLGPNGFNATGDEDLQFTAALLDHMQDTYCIDLDRVFVTGHSWGGDMAHVVSCFLGDRVRASAPAAANDPYWFRTANGPAACAGQVAVWSFFGIADDHFNLDPPGTYGDNARDFWLEQSNCMGVEAADPLDYGPNEQCFDYLGCDVPTRYCLYGPETRHQIPPYFGDAIMAFFRSF